MEQLLEPDLERRFGGLARLYGEEGARHIRNAHVAVVGVGGVGSWAVEALARSGVGQLTLIDLDHVSESNINRQLHAVDATLGQAKVLAMRDRIAQINPACRVNPIEEFVEPANWPEILPTGVNAVIDACDQSVAKFAMAAWAMRHQKEVLFITAGAAGGKRLAHMIEIEDLREITHDPLLAPLRYRLRREMAAPRKGRIGITGVFSRESVVQPLTVICETDAAVATTPDTPATDNTLNCHGYGSVVTVTATFGQCAAGWILDQLARGRPARS